MNTISLSWFQCDQSNFGKWPMALPLNDNGGVVLRIMHLDSLLWMVAHFLCPTIFMRKHWRYLQPGRFGPWEFFITLTSSGWMHLFGIRRFLTGGITGERRFLSIWKHHLWLGLWMISGFQHYYLRVICSYEICVYRVGGTGGHWVCLAKLQ